MALVLNGTTGITSVNGSAAAPSVTGTDTDTGIVYGTNTLSLATGGTTAVTVDSSQNVGVGTISPAYKLDVQGGNASVYNSGAAANSTIAYRNGTKNWYTGLRGDTSNVWAVADDSAFRLVIDSSGNVGIGVSSLSEKFEVGAASSGYSTGTFTANGNYGAGIAVSTNNKSNSWFIGARKDVYGGSAGTDRFNILYGTTAFATIDTSGYVGIGTSSPTEKLDVNGAIKAANSITIGSNGTYAAGSIYSDVNWGMLFRSKQASPTQADFRWANSADVERMRIDSSGNLLVGDTSPVDNSKLLVTQTGDRTAFCIKGASTGGSAHIRNLSSQSYFTAMYMLTSTSTYAGGIYCTDSTTNYATSSDYRLKENIQPMQNALGVVAQLNPVTYTWKADGSDGQGFIAHELAEVVPDAVTGEKDAVDADGNPKYQGIDTSFLVATLTAAIQEQQAIIEQLKADVAELKAAK